MANNGFPKSVPFLRYVKKYSTARHATDDNLVWRMHIACWIIKSTDAQ
jgi:hypothetical protein